MIISKRILAVFLLFFTIINAHSSEFIWSGKSRSKWNDPSSWKLANGEISSAGIPGPNDDVIFEDGKINLFLDQSVEVRNFIVKQNAKLNVYAIDGVTISVYESFEAFHPVKFKDNVNLILASGSNHKLTSSGTKFKGSVSVIGNSSLTITDDLQTEGNLSFGNASILVRANSILCDEFSCSSKSLQRSDWNNLNLISKNNTADVDALQRKGVRVLTGEGRGDNTMKTLCAAPIPFTITATATTNYNGFDVSCNGGSDATICVTVVGGVGPFTFQWVSGPTTSCFSGVDAGNYIVVVFDQGQGGVSCFTTVVVDEPTEMTLLSWTGTDPSCFGTCDGTANPVIVGGVPAYTYSWSTGESTPIATQLCNGLNTVEVTDANGCIFDTSFFILIPTQVDPNLTSQNISCFGFCDGEAYSSPSGGNGAPYTFDWSTGSTNDTITNLCIGTYTIEVTDNNGCLGFDTITIIQPISIAVSVVSITNLVCNNVCSGSITITSSNGTAPHNYQWFDATTGLPIFGATSSTISGLCAGDYFVVVTDAQGCTFTSNDITVTEPPPLTISISANDLECNNVCDGILDAVTAGGTGVLTVNWFEFPATPIGTGDPLNNVCAGTYFAQVTDANGCITTSGVEIINQPPALSFTVVDTDLLCEGDCNGTATGTIGGGTGGLSIEWFQLPGGSEGSTNPINSLCAGNYFGVVTDANGCEFNSDTFTIAEPSALTIVFQGNTDVQCNGACDGTATYTVTGGTGAITVDWFSNPGAVFVGTGSPLAGLCPGTYFAIATDSNGCTIQSGNQTITQPTALSVSVIPTSSECGTACTGSADATITGGNAPYTLTWVNATTGVPLSSTSDPITGLCAGDYFLIVTDDNGCVDTSAIFTITSAVIVDGTITATNVTCNGFCNGAADLSPFGGVTPYTFDWFDQSSGLPIGQSTEDANGLCAGTYFVIVTDTDLCSSVPLQITINEPLPLTASLVSTDVLCNGDCNGTITATITGGTIPYNLDWINATTGISTGQSGITASNLCPDDYTLQIADSNGCVTNTPIETINEPLALLITGTTTDATCPATCDGTATLTISGGTVPYSVTWSSSGNTSTTETGLCIGAVQYTVTDSAGCTDGPNNLVIFEPPIPIVTVVNGSVDCQGDCDGSVSVNVVGGTAPINFQWDAAAGAQTTPVATNLCDGSYNVNLTDANGCIYGPFTATVTEPTTLSISTSVTDALCTGTCDGSATVTIVGGTAPFTISWNDPLSQNTTTAIQLCPGNYTVTVTDAEGCSQTANVTVNASNSPTLATSFTDVTCNGDCNGTATVVVSGGTAPVNLLWDNGSSSNSITSLCAGTYSVTATDANNCTVSANVTINESTLITATLSTVSTPCSVCSGSATVTPSGGTGSYSYQWSASAGSQTTQTATALCAGVHSVDITDGAGCTVTVLVPLSNTAAEVIVLDSINPSCNGICDGTATVSFVCSDAPCTILWTDGQSTPTATSLCDGTIGVTVTNASGCITAGTIELVAPDAIDLSIVGTDVLCNGDCTGQAVSTPAGGTAPYTFSWNDPATQTTSTAFNLCVGDFILTVTDSNGCTGVDTVTIDEPSALTFSTATNDVDCNGQCNGTATAFPSGGNSPYTFQWDDPASQTSQLASGLCAGNFNVTVFDANNCTSGPQTVTINEPTTGTLSISSTNPQCNGNCNGTATVTISGGSPAYTVQWDDPFAQTSMTATNLCAGTYTATVTDANGCVLGSVSVTLTEPTTVAVTLTPSLPTCNALCDGQISSVVTGGTAPYLLQWNDPLMQTGSTANGLCAGTYTLNVIDGNGCSTSANQTLAEPTALNFNLVVTDAQCFNDCNGTATVTPVGGTGAITVLWSPGGQTSTSINSLCTGNYNVAITDANGCSDNQNFIINEPTELTLLTGSSPALCGICDGEASVSPSGGTTPYTIQWDAAAANQTTLTAGTLCAGIYTVDVTDAGGCTQSVSVAVSNSNGESLTVTPTPASCPDVCNGSATATTPCVNGPCTFAWFDVATGNSLGVSANSISNVCPGEYIAQVINSIGCTTLVTTLIDAPDTIEISETITEPLCFGDCNGTIDVVVTGGSGAVTLAWSTGSSSSTLSGLCDGNYTLIATDAAGCDDTVTYSVNEPAVISIVINSTNAPCNAVCMGTATAIVSGGTPGYSFLWDDPVPQTTSTAVSLCDGTYQVTVTDQNGCAVTSSPVVITEPPFLTSSVTQTDPTCNSDCDGTATLTIVGGTAPFVIQWDDPAAQTTATATSLCAGTYQVTVSDANNCTDGPHSVTLTDPSLITAVINSTGISCSGDCSGSITINASGGDGIYVYSIDNGASFNVSNSFTNLCPGSYDVIVMDGSNCTSSTFNVNITEPTALSTTTASVNADCGVNNGSASVFPFGGTPGYTIVWTDNLLTPIGQTTNTAINLGAGIYIATITDANGCQNQQTVTVSNTNAPTVSTTTVAPTCNGDCDASIDATVTGGTPGYTFEWSPNGESTEDISGLCIGTYIQQVTDAAGCMTFTTVVISQPTAVTASISVVDAACGQCDGSAVATASGGTGALSIIWSNLQTGPNATNLCAGSYTVMVTDANGCDDQFNLIVSNTSGPVPIITSTNVNCFNSCVGTASVVPSGGTAPFSILWVETGETTNSISNLCPGLITVEITDSLGCVGIASVNITSPPALSDSISVQPATCGVCDGTAVVFANGVAPLTFQWDAAAGSATTQAVTNLCSGVYSVIVTDGNGCSDTLAGMLPNINAPVVTVVTTDISCNGSCDGTAVATGSGGNPPLTINLLDDLGNLIAPASINFTNLCPDDYILEVTDALGCTSFEPFTITEPDSLVASSNFIQNEICFNTCDGIMNVMPINGTLPYTYNWINPAGQTTPTVTNLCDGIYSVVVTDANGCTITLTDTIGEPNPIIMSFALTDASCSSVADGAIDATVTGGAGGFTYSWSGPSGFTSTNEDLTSIFSGMYILTVTDANGCSLSDTVNLNALLLAVANAGNDTTLCAITSGITLIGTGSPGVTFTWTDTSGNILSTDSILIAPSGSTTTTYILTVNNGGCIGSDTVNVTFNALPNADAGSDVEILVGQTATIGGNPTAASGNSILWTPDQEFTDVTTANPAVSPDSTMNFIVQVTDPNGCVNTDTVLVTVYPAIVFPNGFSPNGDGANDTWILDFIEFFPESEVSVFNRWGQPVFYSKGYDIPWDGTYDNKPVTVGTYYYVILLNHPLFPDAFTGPLTILR